MSSDSDSEEGGMLGGYTPRKRYPVHDAAESGDLETMRRLLAIKAAGGEGEGEERAAGMDVDAAGGAANGDEDGGEEGEEDEEEVDSEADESYVASGAEDEEMESEDEDEDAGQLVVQAADPNEKDNFGCTPLHVAIHAR